jgi:hypothetical protein
MSIGDSALIAVIASCSICGGVSAPALRDATDLLPLDGCRTIQIECAHAMKHSPEFVHQDVGSVGLTISLDQPGPDYGFSRFKTGTVVCAPKIEWGTPSIPFINR